MTNFRLLQTGHQSAAFNMALDEVLINRIANGESQPALRFYGWKPAAVSIGYFQSLEAEVNLEKCAELVIDVVRRQTGGGAVFHDAEATYSMHIPLKADLVPKNILESYKKICDGVINGLGQLDLNASFVPLNDIIVGGKKVSGNAQTRKQGVILQHGTILLDVDVDKMFDLLKVPDEKMKGKLITAIKERVTSIQHQKNEPCAFQEVVDALLTGFQQAFPAITFEPSELTDVERSEVQKLVDTKYSHDHWNSKR